MRGRSLRSRRVTRDEALPCVVSEQGVTVVVSRVIKPGREAEYEAWAHDVAQTAARFPGHLGATVFRPRAGSRLYTFSFRFDTEEHLHAWEHSPERAECLQRAEAFTEHVKVHKETGLETWFANPDMHLAMPPRWKMVIVTWAVAFPLLQLFVRALGATSLPPLVRGVVLSLCMVTAMTYLVMPNITKLLRPWLYR